MSLIQLSSDGSQNNLKNNFTCYFNRGLKIPAFSKIGLVSASLQNSGVSTVIINSENNKLYIRFGLNNLLNNTIEIIIPTGDYTTASLTQYIELEVSKRTNYLPFKKLTVLNKTDMSSEFLQFGTDITPTINDAGLLTAITFHAHQIPSSNTGNVVLTGSTKLMTSYSTKPLKKNFEDVFWDELWERSGDDDVFNAIREKENGTAMVIEVQNLAPNPYTDIDNVIVPIILREWISFNNEKGFTYFVPRPTSADWTTYNDRVVGLISLGDILRNDGTDGLIDGRHHEVGRTFKNFGLKIGVQFCVEGGVSLIKVIALEKQNNGNLPSNVVLATYTLPNNTATGYYVSFKLDRDAFDDINVGEATITVSVNADLSTPVLDTKIDSKKTFIGTKAYPLVPIIYNGTAMDSDRFGAIVEIVYPTATGTECFTNAYIEDTEFYDADSGTNAIPYDPQQYDKIVLNPDTSTNYSTTATGLTTLVPQLDYAGSIFAYLNADETQLSKATDINELITPNFQSAQEQLHPRGLYEKASIGGILGLNENIYKYDKDDSSVKKGSVKFERTELDINDLDGNPSYHIQINNLPIKSLNSVNHSLVPTIAVIPKSSITNRQSVIEPSEVQFLDLNNKEELNLNELSVRITEADNTLTKDLGGTVELICMIKK